VRKSRLSYGTALTLTIGIVAYFFVSHFIWGANIQRVRERMLSQYTATAEWIVFPVALDDDTAALAVINRRNGHRSLVVSRGTYLAFPRFSNDGERVLLIRGKQTGGSTELLSCGIEKWNCRVLVRAPQPIYWPVENGRGAVLYSGSELYAEGRRRKYDFYLAFPSTEPVRLSNFEFYDLSGLNVVGDEILFSTAGPLSRENPVFPSNSDPLAPAISEIFALRVEWNESRIVIPAQKLKPLYRIEGFSLLPASSEDGARVAFLNQRRVAGVSRYNLVIAATDGTVLKYINATSDGFSRPAFVGKTVLANQIFGNRYETTLVDLENNSVRQEMIFDHTSNALGALEHVELTFRNEGGGLKTAVAGLARNPENVRCQN
jgi:hypothetical protein